MVIDDALGAITLQVTWMWPFIYGRCAHRRRQACVMSDARTLQYCSKLTIMPQVINTRDLLLLLLLPLY